MKDQKGLVDEQHLPDVIKMDVDKAGVTNLEVPISIVYKPGTSDVVGIRHVIAKVDAYARLPKVRKGVDMSRLPEVLFEHVGKFLTISSFKGIAKRLYRRLKLKDIYLKLEFPFAKMSVSPVTQKKAVMLYDSAVSIIYPPFRYFVQVKVPVQTVCPCSRSLCMVDPEKQIGKGAHNQRAEVTLQVEVDKLPGVYFETLINIIEKSASSPVYVILKRPDEKYVTERAYDNPVFVEGLARRIADKVIKLKHVKWFRVKVESFESIHKHNAIAYIGRVKRGSKWYRSERGFV
jgi:GTP cyclohydrolase I